MRGEERNASACMRRHQAFALAQLQYMKTKSHICIQALHLQPGTFNPALNTYQLVVPPYRMDSAGRPSATISWMMSWEKMIRWPGGTTKRFFFVAYSVDSSAVHLW